MYAICEFKLGGSVVANRLSELSQFSVLLLEAGDEENFISDVPLTPSVATLTSKILLWLAFCQNFKLNF